MGAETAGLGPEARGSVLIEIVIDRHPALHAVEGHIEADGPKPSSVLGPEQVERLLIVDFSIPSAMLIPTVNPAIGERARALVLHRSHLGMLGAMLVLVRYPEVTIMSPIRLPTALAPPGSRPRRLGRRSIVPDDDSDRMVGIQLAGIGLTVIEVRSHESLAMHFPPSCVPSGGALSSPVSCEQRNL